MQNHAQTHAQPPLIAIIGGSGLYEMQALQSRREHRLIEVLLKQPEER